MLKTLVRLMLVAALLASISRAQIPSTAGWYSIPSTSWSGICPNAGGTRTDIQGQTGCAAVVNAWAGGALDTNRDILYFTGGGHHDYCGNEIYALNLRTLTIKLMNKASDGSGLSGGCSNVTQQYDAMPDGNPAPRHTYGGFTYWPTKDNIVFYGGGPINSGGLVNTVWAISVPCLPGNSTTLMTGCATQETMSLGGDSFNSQFGNLAEYDPNTDSVWVWESWQSQAGHLWQCTALNACTQLAVFGTSPFMEGNQSAAIDPVRKVMYAIGNGKLLHVSIAPGSSFAVTDSSSASGCSSIVSNPYSGVDFDFSDNNIVIWQNGNSVTVYNPSTNSCSTETYTNGPTTTGSNTTTPNSTMGRFRYDPNLHVHVVCDANSENCFTLRRTVDVVPANAFTNRAAGINVPGGASSIVSSQNFDMFPPTTKQSYFNIINAGYITPDCTIAGVDVCALHFQMTGTTGCSHSPTCFFQGEPGQYYYNFNSALTALYGQNSEFYVQFRERIDPAMLNRSTWESTFTDWKQAILSEGDSQTSGQVGDCSNTPSDFVVDSDWAHGVNPWLYENCAFSGGSLAFLQSPYQPVQYPSGGGLTDLLDQSAAGCPHYGSGVNGSTVPIADPTCFNFVANEWETFQIHVKVGTWNTANSVVEEWAQHPGSAARLIVNAADAGLTDNPLNGSVTDKFGKIVLLPYATGATWQAAANVWYDDIIVSNRRIPDDNVSTPNAPDSLSLSAISSHSITVNWRVNSNNSTSQDDTGMLVERCAGTVATCFPNPQSGFSQIGTTVAHAASYVDSTVSSGQTYTYRVRASNGSGNSGYAAAICFNTSGNCGGTALASGSGGAASSPTCSPGTGTYSSAQSVTCTNPNSGTTIMCYTTNGATPASNGSGTGCTTGTQLSGASANVTVAVSETVTIIAGVSGEADSSASAYTYTINTNPTAPAPSMFTITVSAAVVSASLLGGTP